MKLKEHYVELAESPSESIGEKPKYLKYKAAAELLGLPIGTLYSMVSRNVIPHVRLTDRIVLFDEDELLKWVKDQDEVIRRERANQNGERS